MYMMEPRHRNLTLFRIRGIENSYGLRLFYSECDDESEKDDFFFCSEKFWSMKDVGCRMHMYVWVLYLGRK